MEEKTIENQHDYVTNENLLEVINEQRQDITGLLYEMDELSKVVAKLTVDVKSSLGMCRDAFNQVNLAVLACKKALDLCANGYDNCKEAFEDIEIPTQDCSGFI